MNQPAIEELVKQAEELAEDARRCRDEISAADTDVPREKLDERLATIQEQLARTADEAEPANGAGRDRTLSLRQYIGLLVKSRSV
jgi:hypothetical protein